ncbi:hypothetical protein ABT127_34875 [Streptomyces sp. NPDC001904]|uniref:hypothetical protein n=1 Tax=Streptomyces sp. NPDC001904 TaxID=3154531 RepID=UPI0033329ADE
MTDIDGLPLSDAPLPPLLPLLSLEEAQAALSVLAAVVNGDEPDFQTARWLLANLAARVPSRE